MRIALVGNAQAQAARLKRLLPFEAEILLDDETRATRVAPLEVDAALSIRFNAADIAAVRCRLLQCTGVGIDGIALAQVPADTIVCNVHEHEIPIAEYVLAGILDHEIGLFRAEKGFESAQWGELFRARKTHGEVQGKSIGIIGFGRIGKAVAVRARAFGMRIIAVNRSGRPSAEADAILPFDRIGEVLAEADYLVLACPLTEDTRGLIDRDAFARMKPSALLVNVARGEVVDEEALWNAMSEGQIGGALIDTWYTYPTLAAPNPKPSRFPFETLPNVRCTPHISAWTEGMMERRYKVMAENLTRFNNGDALLNVVWRDGKAVEGT
jgi:phosphoglycerate dehydrogenase-like enzyme